MYNFNILLRFFFLYELNLKKKNYLYAFSYINKSLVRLLVSLPYLFHLLEEFSLYFLPLHYLLFYIYILYFKNGSNFWLVQGK